MSQENLNSSITSQNQSGENSNKITKKDQNQKSYLSGAYATFVNFVNSKQFVYSSLGAIGGVMGLYYVKKGILDRFKSITETEKLAQSGKYASVLLGNMFFLGWLQSPSADGWNYSISFLSDNYQERQNLENKLKNASGTEIYPTASLENGVVASLIALPSLWLTFKMFQMIQNQHTYDPKKKEDMDLKQIPKSFEDIGGCEDAKEAIREIIDYIRNPEPYKKMGVVMPKGVLLYGPPGTGKTLMAKAAATEAGIPMIYASGSEFVELYVGLGAKRIRELFKEARRTANRLQTAVMIFIDEVDAVGFKRNGGQGYGFGNRETETTLNQLLNEMDGFEENSRIVVVAATNLIQNIDPALQRAKRFDRKIEIKLPDPLTRRKILEIHLRGKKHRIGEKELSYAAFALDGCSGADLENLVNLMALHTIRTANLNGNRNPVISTEDFNVAVKNFIQERQNASQSPRGQVNRIQYPK